jgi:hypothetical protein
MQEAVEAAAEEEPLTKKAEAEVIHDAEVAIQAEGAASQTEKVTTQGEAVVIQAEWVVTQGKGMEEEAEWVVEWATKHDPVCGKNPKSPRLRPTPAQQPTRTVPCGLAQPTRPQ